MAPQNPNGWEFSLVQLSNDPIQLSQPLTFRRCLRDETKTFECRVQPYWNSDPRQLSLISLISLQPDARALIMVLKTEVMFIEGHQVVFERRFENTNESQMMSHFFNEVDHRLWLQGLLNHLGRE
jgi:hypothetical protein